MPGGPGVRLDSFVDDQFKVVPFYDSMIAKLIVHAPTRQEAILRMKQALSETIIGGIKTNVPFHRKLMMDKVFGGGEFDTHFLENSFSKYE